MKRRDRAADLYLQGKTQVEIKAEQLARIDWVERQATEAWFRSLEDAERVMVTVDEDDSDGGDQVGKKTTETKGQSGNDKYLARIAWCVEQRLKIFGLYAPTKIAPTNPKGDSAFSLDVVVRGLTDDQLEALRAANDQLHRVTAGIDDGRHD